MGIEIMVIPFFPETLISLVWFLARLAVGSNWYPPLLQLRAPD